MNISFRRFSGRRARTAVLAAGVALAFGAGAATVYAIDPGGSGGSPPAPPPSLTPRAVAPGIATGGDIAPARPAIAIGRGPGSVVNSAPPAAGLVNTPQGGGLSSSSAYAKDGIAPGCPAVISKVVAGSTIDPSGEGFQMSLLKSGFSLQSISVRGEGTCGDKGVATDGKVVVDSSWVHDATGVQVFLSQRVSAKALASVRVPGHAEVSTAGYVFSINANPYTIYADGPMAAGGSSATPAIYPGGPQPTDPKVTEVLDAAVAQVAPGFDKACFYVQKDGGWSDLAALGIGDPRPALPKGFSEQGTQFMTFTAPPASCNAPALDQRGGFSANFVLDSGSKDGSSFLAVSAFGLPGGQPAHPGYFDSSNANWSNGSFQFSVSGGGPGGPLGEDVIRAIATAMDPGFANACLMKNRQLTEPEFLALGYRAPVVPEAFKLASSQFNASELSANCTNLPAGAGNSANGNWHYAAGTTDTFLDVNINRFAGAGDKFGRGSISGYGLNWTDGKGTQYSVNGFTGRKETLGKDVLIAVAKSIDPTLDVSKLDEQPQPTPPVMPQPYMK